MIRQLQLLIITLLFSLGAFAYSGYVGDYVDIKVSVSASDIYSIDWKKWSGSTDCVTLISNWGNDASVHIDSYFTGNVRIVAQYKTTKNLQRTEYFDITCNPVTLNPSPSSLYNMKVGDTEYITYTTSPSGKWAEVYYSSSNSSVAKVDWNTGKVTAVSEGKAFITLSNNLGPSATVDVVVASTPNPDPSIKVSEINLNYTSITRNIGDVLQLTATVSPSNATNKSVSWYSNNTSVATVSSTGLVTAKAAGNATITCAAQDGSGVKATCKITVDSPQLTLSASPKGGIVSKGTKIYLTASDDKANIYYTTDGTEPTSGNNRYSYLSYVTINESCTLKAIAEKSEYKSSEILTETYSLATIKTTGTNMADYGDVMGQYSVPTITFNMDIREGTNYQSITLKNQEGKNIDHETFVSGNKLYIVPSNDFDVNVYTITIPDDAIVGSKAGDIFPSQTFTFSVKEKPKTNVVVSSICYNEGSKAILKSDGSLWTWGANWGGQLGNGTDADLRSPVEILDNVSFVYGGGLSCNTIAAIKNDKTLWMWGSNSNGEVGDGSTNDRNTPKKILDDVTYVESNEFTTYAIKTDGTLWSWGTNQYGALGQGSYSDYKSTPGKVLDNVRSVSGDYYHAFAVTNDNKLFGWGYNYGNAVSEQSGSSRKPIELMNSVSKVFTQSSRAYALKTDGSLWAWGTENYKHGIGTGSTDTQKTPVKILNNVKDVVISYYNGFAITQDGDLYAWGSNEDGQIGNGNKDVQLSPVKVLTNVKEVYATEHATQVGALKTDGTLWIWGKGCIGDGTYNGSVTPKQILDNVKQAAVYNSNYTMAVRNDGTLWVWGNNPFQGNNINAPTGWTSSKPIKVIDDKQKIPLSSISLEMEDNINVGNRYVCVPKLNPYNADYKSINWSSSNTNVATVNNRGVISAKSKGIATITIEVKSEDGSKITKTITVTVNSSNMDLTFSSEGYATFYDSQTAYKLPSGITAKVVTGASNNKLTYKTIAEGNSSGVLPKGTAVMLSNERKSSGTFTLTATDDNSSYTGTNMLRGSDNATTTTGAGLHYLLSYGQTGTNLNDVFGWYWGAQNGVSFQIEGHKAWLVVPVSVATRGYAMDEESIQIMDLESDIKEDNVYYDMQGRRVKSPSKRGLYIKDGKKVSIK